MTSLVDVFKILTAKVGTHRNAIFVAVDKWTSPASLADKQNLICLSQEVENGDSLDRTINDLISQLELIRAKGHKELDRIKQREAAKVAAK